MFVSLYVICACVLRILTNVCYTSTRWLGWKLDICPRLNICPSTLSESDSLLKWAKLICHRYKTCHSGSFFWDLICDTIFVVDTKWSEWQLSHLALLAGIKVKSEKSKSKQLKHHHHHNPKQQHHHHHQPWTTQWCRTASAQVMAPVPRASASVRCASIPLYTTVIYNIYSQH